MERNGTPELLPIFRSKQQAELLTWLFDHPGEEWSITDIALRLGIPITSVHREVGRAERAGLVRSRRLGNVRLVSPDVESVYFEPLQTLLVRAFGPPTVLAKALSPVNRIDAAYIFGSWAARWHGEAGQRPVGDLDLLVLGEPDPTEVYTALADVESLLGREVQVVLRPTDWLDRGGGSFHETVRSRALVPVLVAQDEMAERTRSTALEAMS